MNEYGIYQYFVIVHFLAEKTIEELNQLVPSDDVDVGYCEIVAFGVLWSHCRLDLVTHRLWG